MSLKLDLKGEGNKNQVTGDKPGSGLMLFEGWCFNVVQATISVDVGNGDP